MTESGSKYRLYYTLHIYTIASNKRIVCKRKLQKRDLQHWVIFVGNIRKKQKQEYVSNAFFFACVDDEQKTDL